MAADATNAVIERLRAALCGRADVELALLFGSAARGEAMSESDLDVAVLAPGVDRLALAAALRDATHREIDLVSLEGATIPLMAELLADGVVAHEGQSGANARWRARTWLALELDQPWYRKMRDAFLARLAHTAPRRAER